MSLEGSREREEPSLRSLRPPRLPQIVLALAMWGVAILIRAAWGTGTIAGVLPVAAWVVLRTLLGLYAG